MRSLVFLAGLLLSSPVMATSDTELTDIAGSRQWQKLLQYNESAVSEVKNASFFLSPAGATDPVAELTATLHAFATDPRAMCLFPGRHFYLSRHELTPPSDYQHCEAFREWLRADDISSVSLIFADGYLKNPASFHGHLFIRLNSGTDIDSHLLDTSLNFGAEVPDKVNPVSYILSGLFGGYDSAYSAQPFYRHQLTYGQVELRNLWDYELNLSEDDAFLLSAHLWELSRTEYQYFFAGRNCAYYLARALEVVTEKNLVSSAEWLVLPTQIIRRLNEPDRDMVRSVTLNESEQKKMQEQYHRLDSASQVVVRKWITAGQDTALLEPLSADEQKRVLITLASYYSFRERDEPGEATHEAAKTRVLNLLMRLPSGNNHQIAPTGSAPHGAQPESMLRLSGTRFSEHSNQYSLTYRPTYYDRLQPHVGRLPQSALSMMEFEVSYQDDKLQLDRLWLINIEALNISATGLPADGGDSWLLRSGLQRNKLRDINAKASLFLEGGLGKAWRFGELIPYAMLQGRLHTDEVTGDRHNATASVRAGLEGSLWNRKFYCEAEKPIQIGHSVTAQNLISRCAAIVTQGFNFDLRLSYENQNEQQLSVAFSYYF